MSQIIDDKGSCSVTTECRWVNWISLKINCLFGDYFEIGFILLKIILKEVLIFVWIFVCSIVLWRRAPTTFSFPITLLWISGCGWSDGFLWWGVQPSPPSHLSRSINTMVTKIRRNWCCLSFTSLPRRFGRHATRRCLEMKDER